jgi:hypothetical protein
MLTDVDLLAWYTKLGLRESARAVIDHIRSSDPARRAGGGRRNVSGFYPSKKMGVTIQFESHRVELAAVYELEHHDSVLEYFDQPPSFKLEYDGTDGRRLGVLHTADYFGIRRDCAGWEECKTEEELVLLNRKNPNRYARDRVGRWICPQVRRMRRHWDSITGYGRRGISIGCTSAMFSSWRTICGARFQQTGRHIKLFLPTSERCQAFRWTSCSRLRQVRSRVTTSMP